MIIDRRTFLVGSAGAVAAGLIAACDGGSSGGSAGSSTIGPDTTADTSGDTTSTMSAADGATTTAATEMASTTIASSTTSIDAETTVVTAPAVPSDLGGLAATMQGTVTVPGDKLYEQLRLLQCTVFDDTMPTAIVAVASADDVSKSIAFARANALPIAVRSGGHSYGGWSSGPGLVIDLRGLAGVAPVATDGTVAIGPGTQLIDVYTQLGAQGLALAGGSCPTVGIGGLTLGGGHGLTSRSVGLTCDALVAVELVTADGVVHHCDAQTDADLYWASRGGSGSFGVVTGFTFQPHPVPPAATTFVFKYSWQHSAAMLAAWMQWVGTIPNETATIARLESTTSGMQLVVAGLHLGSVDEATTVLTPMNVSTTSASVTARSFADALLLEAGCLHDSAESCHTTFLTDGGTLDRQTPFVASSLYFDAPLGDDAIAAARAAVEAHATTADTCTIQFDSYGGAIAALAPDATAFVHRNAFCSSQFASFFTSGDGSGDRDWIRSTHDALAPFGNGESYQNYADAGLDDWATAYYGDNLGRLQQIKARYDPEDVFSFPQSIPVP